MLLIGAGQHAAAAAHAALLDGAEQADPFVHRVQRLQPFAAFIGDIDLDAAIARRRGVAAGGKREREEKKAAGREMLHVHTPAPLPRHAAAFAPYCVRSETLSILPVPSRGSGASANQI